MVRDEMQTDTFSEHGTVPEVGNAISRSRRFSLTMWSLLAKFGVVAALCLMQPAAGQDGGPDRRARDYYPDWSPDGQWIVFQTDVGGNPDICLMRADGSGLRRLTHDLADDFYPSWSPDGKSILFHSDRNGRADIGTEDLDIYSISFDGTDVKAILTDQSNDFFPRFSPDGKRIAYNSDKRSDRDVYNIYVLDLASGKQTNVTADLEEAFDPTWSPDGSRIAFSAPNPYHDGMYDIYAVNAEGKSLVNLTNDPTRHDFNPSWSTAANKIVFQVGQNGAVQLAVLDLETNEVKQLTSGDAGNDTPGWSPDGSRIVFSSHRDGNWEIYVMNADGSEPKRLTSQ